MHCGKQRSEPAWTASSQLPISWTALAANQLNLLSCQSAEPPQLPNQLNCLNCPSAELPQLPISWAYALPQPGVTGTCVARDRLKLGIPNPELWNRKGQPSNRGTFKFLQQVKNRAASFRWKTQLSGLVGELDQSWDSDPVEHLGGPQWTCCVTAARVSFFLCIQRWYMFWEMCL